jgi:hypothetical protein
VRERMIKSLLSLGVRIRAPSLFVMCVRERRASSKPRQAAAEPALQQMMAGLVGGRMQGTPSTVTATVTVIRGWRGPPVAIQRREGQRRMARSPHSRMRDALNGAAATIQEPGRRAREQDGGVGFLNVTA